MDACNSIATRMLLVEGNDDCHVVRALCKKHELLYNFSVYACDGFPKLLAKANALLLSAENRPSVLGLVLDADGAGAKERLRAVTTKLARHAYPNLHTLPAGGSVNDVPGRPRLGLWIMPNNRDAGAIEDFLLEMIDADAREQAEKCVDIVMGRKISQFKRQYKNKAVLRTYLAWQAEPGLPPGYAITRHALQHDAEIAIAFAAWLRKLFVAE